MVDLDELEDEIEMIDSFGLSAGTSTDGSSFLLLLLELLLVGDLCLLSNYCKLNCF